MDHHPLSRSMAEDPPLHGRTIPAGVHLCLGAVLARLEAKVAFEELLGRFPGFETHEGQATRSYGSNVRGWATMPTTLHG